MSDETLVINMFDNDRSYKATIRRTQEVEVDSSRDRGSDGFRHWVDAEGNDYGPIAFSILGGGWEITTFDEISESEAEQGRNPEMQ